MKEKILAKMYAEAFLEYARETVGLDTIIDEFKNLKVVLYENPQLKEFFGNPEIPFVDKCEFLDKVFKENFSGQMRQFLKLLMEKERIKYIIDICDYIRVTYSHGQALEAVLKTSYPLDLEVVREIKAKLENKLGKKINLYQELDGDLLGGLQIRIGNMIIDGSVRKRIDELRKKLMLVEVS
jgi:F-type H+-transporting ATPase subunit delta